MKIRNKKQGFKKFLIGGMLALSVFSTSFLVHNFEHYNAPVLANYTEAQSSITNSDFTQYSTSSTPYSPTGWTFNNPTNKDSIKYGVVNMSDSVFSDNKEEYELDSAIIAAPGNITQGTSDPLYKSLMINSYTGSAYAGYSSSAFTLEANSYYSIAVTLYTKDIAKASIYLSGLTNSDVDAKITNISTSSKSDGKIVSNWETYYIFIETNQFTSESVTLELWLGDKDDKSPSSGAVFFNSVSLTRYSESSYRTKINSSDATKSKNISLYTPYYEDLITNSSFDKNIDGDYNAISGWTTIESSNDDNQMLKTITTNNYTPSIDTEDGISNPRTNFKSTDDTVLFIYNKTSGSQGIKSNEFTIKQNELYMISVWAKSNCNTGSGATIKLEQVSDDEDDKEFTPVTATLKTSTSTSTNKFNNDWSQYKIFVEGHPLQDTKVTLQLWLGTEETNTNGYVFIDDISVQRISYANYSEGNSSSNSTTYSYNTNNTQFLVTNGNFNVTKKKETKLTYPLGVSNWTLTTEDETNEDKNLSGVINTKSDQFQLFKDYIDNNNVDVNIANPGLTPIQKIDGATLDNSSNNVLMIANNTSTSQSYLSDSFALTSGSYYKISMLVNTQIYSTDKNAGAKIVIKNDSFTAIEVENINTNSEWEQIEIFVHAGSLNTNFTIALELNNTTGFAFFDDVKCVDSTETAFNATLKNNQYKTELNLQDKDIFDCHSLSDTALSTLYNWKSTNNSETDNVVFGALDTTKNINEVFPTLSNPGSTEGNNVLVLNTINDAYYTLSSLQKISLTSGSFYKISVTIKTSNISQEVHTYNKENETDEETEDNMVKYGAFISLDGYDDMFTAIDTERDLETGYVTYDFLIKPSSDVSTFVNIGIGGENNLASGFVIVDNIAVTTLSNEAAYNEEIENKTIRTIVLGDQSTDTTETEDSGTDFTGSPFDWLLVPSLLTGLAVIIAIVGTVVRRFKYTKTPKIKTKYDRRKTLEVDLDKRERIELRKEIIDELNNEYNDISKEIDALTRAFELEKAKIEKEQKERLEAYESVKQAIIVEREKVTRDYNDKLNSKEELTQEDKSKYEKEFKQYIKKLDKRASAEAKKYNKKDTSLQVAEYKYNLKTKELTDKQKYIQEEIARIEREIEEISKQEEIMWNVYRKAKEEAKKEKLAYLASKREAKEKAKLEKLASKKQSSNSKENSVENNVEDDTKQSTNTSKSSKESSSNIENNKNEETIQSEKEEKIDSEVLNEVDKNSVKETDSKESDNTNIASNDETNPKDNKNE